MSADVARPARPRVVLLASRAYSGSTLLAALLGSHPDIATVSEVSGHQRQDRMATFPCSCGRLMLECPFWADVAQAMRSRGITDFDLANFRLNFGRGQGTVERFRTGSLRWDWAEDARDALVGLVPGNGHAMEQLGRRNVAFAQSVLEVTGASVFVDASKERMRIRYASRHMDADLRVIHLVRDVRGVVDSAIRHANGPVDLEATARHWARTNETLRRHGERLGADRYRLVRYEELCADPTRTMQSLFAFSGVAAASSGSSQRDLHLIGNARRLDADWSEIRADERWRDRFDAANAARIMRAAGPSVGRFYGGDTA